MTTHYISRRRLLSVAAGGTVLVLAGCGSAGLPYVPGAPRVGTGDPGSGGADPLQPAPAPSVAAQSETVIAADVDGSLFEIEPADNSVARLGGGGVVLWETGRRDLNWPRSIAIDSHGTICVANHGDSSIAVYDPIGAPLGELGGPGTGPGEFNLLPDLAFDAEDRLYAVDALNHRIQVLDGTGTMLRTFGEPGSGPGQLNAPRALAFDSEGNVHVLDAGNVRVQVFDPAGRPVVEYGGYGSGEGQFRTPYDLAIDAWDRVYVTDPATRRVLVFEDAGDKVVAALEPADENGDPVTPLRVSIDSAGGLLLSVSPIVQEPTGV